MAKSADAFRTISEVAEWLDTPAHVLRFWESKFTQVRPVKRAGGRRYYRPQDMKLLGGIKKLLHEDGMTIKGVQKLLREQGVKQVAALSQPLAGEEADAVEAMTPPPAPEPAQVLDFRRATEEQTEPETEPEDAPAPEPAAPAAESEAEPAAQAPEVAEPEPEGGPEAGTEAPTAPEPETEPEAEPEPAPAASIPTFLDRRAPEHVPGPNPAPAASGTEAPPGPTGAPDSEPEPEREPEPEPEPEPTAPEPLVADVPATDPDDDEFARPGILTQVARLRRPLGPPTVKAVTPILKRLKEKLDEAG